MLVDNPILNSPFESPGRHWTYKEGQPVLMGGRRPAGYYLKPRTQGGQTALFEEEFVPLDTVNTVRDKVDSWREKGYLQPKTTRQLYCPACRCRGSRSTALPTRQWRRFRSAPVRSISAGARCTTVYSRPTTVAADTVITADEVVAGSVQSADTNF